MACASAERVGRLAGALVANRRLARGGEAGLAVLELGAGGSVGRADTATAPRPASASLSRDGGELEVHGLMGCRELLLLATGAGRAGDLRDALVEPPSPACPASLLRAHPRLTVLCDPAAAAELPPSAHRTADHVAIVLGHREPGRSAEHRISHESHERLLRAARLVHATPTRAVILTGYTSTGGLSEAEQMALAWGPPDVPFLLEDAGRTTAENATRSLPLVLALGGIRRVTVVTSAWHVRTRYFFAPYRRRGQAVAHRREWRGGDFFRMLADELRKAAYAPAARRRAWSVGELEPEPDDREREQEHRAHQRV